MKKILAVLLILALTAAIFTGCGEKATGSKSISYNGKEYKTGFYGDYEFLHDTSEMVESEFTLDGMTYQVLNLEEHDFIITKEANPTVFCAAEEWADNKAFYSNPENIFYAIAFGDPIAPLDKIHVTGMEGDMYQQLCEFNQKHSFNPKHPKADKDQVLIPKPETEDSQIHFYKESSDELFSVDTGNIYYAINDQIVRYYAEAPEYSNDEQTVCYVVVMPEDLTAFITELIGVLTALNSSGTGT